MPELKTSIPIFISSTFIDLKELRSTVSARLRDVLGAQLITMETFGSDDAPPDILSVRQVRQCDIFVGIYARRYGTVDQMTGKSITELELDEAERAFSAGTLTGILLYLLEDDAPWPEEFIEADSISTGKLSLLKQRARQHTVTRFRSPEDLPFMVIKGVLDKIRHRVGMQLPQARHFSLPPERKLHQPIGMEFLTSADKRHLFGRGDKITEILERLDSNPITLLLGNSGAGKTSLIHAGLLPVAVEKGWLPIYSRPLGLPRTDVLTTLFSTVFEGTTSYRGSLVPLLQETANAVQPRKPLLIIDQFEDILMAREQEESERLVADLRTLRYISEPNIRVLVSYRADLEARLGQFWQQISGSPQGLPRVYVSGISAEEAWNSVKSTCQDLGVSLEMTPAQELQIGEELLSFSRTHGQEGVYPPYIQMLIDHAWQTIEAGKASYSLSDYMAAGGMERVTGGYLARQLAYAKDKEGNLAKILVALVRSYGIKAQKSLSEMSADVGLPADKCESLLERLIDLRLVRHLGDQYEIAHDFLAHEISDTLVDSEEREFKRFRELLTTKAAAFSTTHDLLTVGELLVLFKHKERVLPSGPELKILLASWAREEGPGLFWLLNAIPARVIELIGAEEIEADLEREERAMLVLLRQKVTGMPFRGKDWWPFKRYKLGIQLAHLLSGYGRRTPDSVIRWAMRSKHGSVRASVAEVLAEKVATGSRNWISELGKSSSPFRRAIFEALSLRKELHLPPKKRESKYASRPMQEFALLQEVSRARNDAERRAAVRALQRFRPRARTWLYAWALSTFRTVGLQPILSKLPKMRAEKIEVVLSPVDNSLTKREFSVLFREYKHWNKKESLHIEDEHGPLRAIYESKATALSKTILRVATKRNLRQLRQGLEDIILTPSSEHCALALVRTGQTKDVLHIIRKIEGATAEVRYWFHMGIAQAIERRMTELGAVPPPVLLRICQRRAFWESPFNESSKFRRRDLLPIRHGYNQTLYRRLVAHAVIGAATLKDVDLLKKMALHDYRMIARAAAIRLTELTGDQGIRTLQSLTGDAVATGQVESLSLAIREAELHASGVAQLW
jgi:hypothetical protein